MSGAPKTSAEVDPAGSYVCNMSVASSSRVLPRVEAGDILISKEELGKWKQRTSLAHPILWWHVSEGVVSPEYKEQALMIVNVRLTRLMLKEGRAYREYFSKLWTWLNELYAERSTKLIAAQYPALMSMKMTAS